MRTRNEKFVGPTSKTSSTCELIRLNREAVLLQVIKETEVAVHPWYSHVSVAECYSQAMCNGRDAFNRTLEEHGGERDGALDI